MNKRWKPQVDSEYFSIMLEDNAFKVDDAFIWWNTRGDKYQYRIGNVFRTKKQAQEKLRQIKEILKEEA